MPGRKTLVLFSEGLPASPALEAGLQAVVEAANRANITVYAIDASGLRAVSGTLETRREIEEASKERLRQLSSPSDYTDQPIMRLVERTEDLMKLDSHAGLARLANDTGGFLVSETNNLRGALRRIDEDTRFHYLLTYVPKNLDFDGRFRAIGVKVKRPGVDVYARNGYRALRKMPTVPVLGYEGPTIAALDSAKLPNRFPFSSTVMNFPESKRTGLSPLVVRVKTDQLTYEEHPDAGTYDGEAIVVARYKDAKGEVVHKDSQQYHLTGRLNEIENARKGEILFYREPMLAPGTYTVEVAVTDTYGPRSSARVGTIEVPRASSNDLRISSLVLIGKMERVTDNKDLSNPLYAGDVLIYPSGGTIDGRRGDHILLAPPYNVTDEELASFNGGEALIEPARTSTLPPSPPPPTRPSRPRPTRSGAARSRPVDSGRSRDSKRPSASPPPRTAATATPTTSTGWAPGGRCSPPRPRTPTSTTASRFTSRFPTRPAAPTTTCSSGCASTSTRPLRTPRRSSPTPTRTASRSASSTRTFSRPASTMSPRTIPATW
jgi:hypothetical protein